MLIVFVNIPGTSETTMARGFATRRLKRCSSYSAVSGHSRTGGYVRTYEGRVSARTLTSEGDPERTFEPRVNGDIVITARGAVCAGAWATVTTSVA